MADGGLAEFEHRRTDVPHGRPDPTLFLLAAKALAIPADNYLVVEDAPAGILAAHVGGMTGLGIARLGDQALLHAAGVDLVVTSLDQVDTAAIADGVLRVRPGAERPHTFRKCSSRPRPDRFDCHSGEWHGLIRAPSLLIRRFSVTSQTDLLPTIVRHRVRA